MRQATVATPAARRVTRLPLFALFTAEALSMTGNVVTLTAIPWFVLETTGSAARTGITAFFTTLPAVLSAFFGGVLVDRIGPKRASVIADVASGVTVAAVPLLHHSVGLAFWQLLVLVFLGALLDMPGQTARKALLPDLAEAAGMRLERANATTQAINRGARMAGAPLAGLLIVLLGASNALWVDAATFMVSAVLVGVGVPAAGRLRERVTEREAAPGGYLQQLREGLSYLRRDRLVSLLVLVCMVANFLDGPKLAVLLPIYANQVLGSSVALGVIVGTYGGTALLGAVVYGAVGHRWPRRAVLIGALLTFCLPFWALATRPPLPVMLAAVTIAGLASGPLNPLLMTVLQERVPPDLRGRVFGITMAGSFAAMPLGMLVTGALVEVTGFVPTVAAMGCVYLLFGLSLFGIRALRELGGRGARASTD